MNRFEESKHPRGQPENAGQFGPGGGGPGVEAKGTRYNKNGGRVANTRHEHARATKAINKRQAMGEPAPLKLKILKGMRVFGGQTVPTEVRYSKSDTGKIGENIIISYLRLSGKKDARHLNLDRNNFPIDLIQDHESIEAKAGLVSNGKGAQQWRLTIGEPGKEEKARLSKMTEETKAKINAKKQAAIVERKKKCLENLKKKLGHPVKAATITCILNPDTKTADIFKFNGWHDRIGWNSEEAKKAYVCTVQYG